MLDNPSPQRPLQEQFHWFRMSFDLEQHGAVADLETFHHHVGSADAHFAALVPGQSLIVDERQSPRPAGRDTLELERGWDGRRNRLGPDETRVRFRLVHVRVTIQGQQTGGRFLIEPAIHALENPRNQSIKAVLLLCGDQRVDLPVCVVALKHLFRFDPVVLRGEILPCQVSVLRATAPVQVAF